MADMLLTARLTIQEIPEIIRKKTGNLIEKWVKEMNR